MASTFLQGTILYIHFEGFLNQNKIDWVHGKQWFEYLKIIANLKISLKIVLNVLSSHQINLWCYGLVIFSHASLKAYRSYCEGFANWNEIDGMVSNHLSSCKLHQSKTLLYNNSEPHKHKATVRRLLLSFTYLIQVSRKVVNFKPKYPRWCTKGEAKY